MIIIADEEVLFYFDNVSEKITFYEKFESQNKATDQPLRSLLSDDQKLYRST